MINDIIETVVKPRLEALSTIGVLGGLVNTVYRDEEREGLPSVRLSYPVGCGVSSTDCWRDKRYLALTPDNSKVSVAFAECVSQFFPATDHPKRLAAAWRVKYYFWANLAEMGVSDCSIPFSILEEWRKALTFTGDGAPYSGVGLSSDVLSAISTEEASRVWGKWTFGQNQGLFMYPYAWCVFDLEVKANYHPDCIPAYTPTVAIKCITI